MISQIRSWIWDTTTSIVADSIALVSPLAANKYRKNRESYKRAYVAASAKGPYQLHKPSNKSGDAEVSAGSSMVRAKVRDLSRNNPMVAGMKRKLATMVVGDEIGIKAQVVGADGKPDAAINAELEKRFYRWSETACSTGDSLTEALYLIENHLFEDGEIMVRDIAVSGSQNPYRIQLLEVDYIDSSAGSYGVDYDSVGRPLAYHLYTSHPGGNEATYGTERVSADLVTLLAETDRSSQRRGISPVAAAVFSLFGVQDLEEAELVAARSGAAYGLVITSPMVDSLPYQTYGTTSESQPQDNNSRDLDYLEAGGILRLSSGEDAKAFSSDRPNSNFDSFIRGRHRSAVGAVGMSYETGTGDYSQVNYSSARMGRLIEWANVRRRQNRLKRLLNRIYRKWLRFEVTLGKIPGITPAAYNANTEAFEAVSWQLAGNDGIDPVKEINAFEAELALGVNSRTRFAAERGRDFAEVCKEIAEEKQILEALGIYQEDPLVPKVTTESMSKSISATTEDAGSIEEEGDDEDSDEE